MAAMAQLHRAERTLAGRAWRITKRNWLPAHSVGSPRCKKSWALAEPGASQKETGLLLTRWAHRDAKRAGRWQSLAHHKKKLDSCSLGGLTAIRACITPDGIAVGRLVSPVLTTRIQASLRRGAKRVQAREIVLAELLTPGPLRRRCGHNQAHRPRVQGREGWPVSAYETIKMKHAQR